MKKLNVMLAVMMFGLFFGATDVLADEFVCRGTFVQRSFDNVVVPSGASCRLDRAAVKGNIVVQSNGSLETNLTRINGSVQSEGYNSVIIGNKSRVIGSVQLKYGNTALITRSTINGDVQFEENFGRSTAELNSIGGSLQGLKNRGLVRFISNVFVAGNIQSTENTAGVEIRNNQTDANLQVYVSSGGIFITDNVVAENLQCSDNQPPLISKGNIVGGEDECPNL